MKIMKIDVIRKDYGDTNHPVYYAYINDYRVYGSKLYGLSDINREIIVSGNKKVEIEIWRTMQKKGYSIHFAYKVNGKPCNKKWLSDYVFNAPEDCRRLWTKFTIDLSQVSPECKHRHNKPSDWLEEDVDLFYLK